MWAGLGAGFGREAHVARLWQCLRGSEGAAVAPQRELVTARSSSPRAPLLNNASAALSGHLFLPVFVV